LTLRLKKINIYGFLLRYDVFTNSLVSLEKVVNLDLPPGWMREEDPNGAIYYHNPGENQTTTKHPMIAKFRSLFNEILEYLRNNYPSLFLL